MSSENEFGSPADLMDEGPPSNHVPDLSEPGAPGNDERRYDEPADRHVEAIKDSWERVEEKIEEQNSLYILRIDGLTEAHARKLYGILSRINWTQLEPQEMNGIYSFSSRLRFFGDEKTPDASVTIGPKRNEP